MIAELERTGIRYRWLEHHDSPVDKQDWDWSQDMPSVSTAPRQRDRLADTLKKFSVAHAADRPGLRQDLVRRIAGAESPGSYIEEALLVAVDLPTPGRLDDAIDILAEVGNASVQFANHAMFESPQHERDDDYWYVLVRAACEVGDESTTRTIVNWAMDDDRRMVREAAVEVLGDLDKDWALAQLREMQSSDPSSLIRDLAVDMIAERPR